MHGRAELAAPACLDLYDAVRASNLEKARELYDDLWGFRPGIRAIRCCRSTTTAALSCGVAGQRVSGWFDD